MVFCEYCGCDMDENTHGHCGRHPRKGLRLFSSTDGLLKPEVLLRFTGVRCAEGENPPVRCGCNTWWDRTHQDTCRFCGDTPQVRVEAEMSGLDARLWGWR